MYFAMQSIFARGNCKWAQSARLLSAGAMERRTRNQARKTVRAMSGALLGSWPIR
jgi:hypothetical protein